MIFCATTLNGQTYCSIEHHPYGSSKEPILGSTVRCALTPGQQELSLDVLTKLYREHRDRFQALT